MAALQFDRSSAATARESTMKTSRAHHRRSTLRSRLIRPVLLIPAFGLLLILALWVATLAQLSTDKKIVLDHALEDTQRVAVAFEQHTLRVIKEIDRSALKIKYDFEANGTANLEKIRANSLLLPDEVDRVSIANSTGEIVANTRDSKPFSVADRPYFRFHMAQDTTRLDISEPVMSRASNESVIVFSRRLNSTDEKFAGVVALSMRPSGFTDFYQESQLGKNGFVGVIGRDGGFRAWRVGGRTIARHDGGKSRVFAMVAASPTGVYQANSEVDGMERMVVYRTIDNYPLVVA